MQRALAAFGLALAWLTLTLPATPARAQAYVVADCDTVSGMALGPNQPLVQDRTGKLCGMPGSVTTEAEVDLREVNGQAVNVGTGAAGTGTQRVTTSTDSTIGTVTSVTTLTTITNPVGVKGSDGSGIASTANPFPTALYNSTGTAISASTTNSDTLAAGANPTNLNTNSWVRLWNATNGSRWYQAADGLNSSGTGIATSGGVAQCDDTSPTALTENFFGNVRITCNTHAIITRPYESSANSWNYAAASGGISNTTTAVTIKAAGSGSLKNCVTGLQVVASPLGAATEVAIRDGAGGTVLWRTYMGTAGGTANPTLQTPICGTAATLLEVVTLTATITGGVYVNAQGYVAP